VARTASFLPALFIARLFAAVTPLPNLAPTWNMAPARDARVVPSHRWRALPRRPEVGLDALLHQGPEEWRDDPDGTLLGHAGRPIIARL